MKEKEKENLLKLLDWARDNIDLLLKDYDEKSCGRLEFNFAYDFRPYVDVVENVDTEAEYKGRKIIGDNSILLQRYFLDEIEKGKVKNEAPSILYKF